jgi:hypothetical protein
MQTYTYRHNGINSIWTWSHNLFNKNCDFNFMYIENISFLLEKSEGLDCNLIHLRDQPNNQNIVLHLINRKWAWLEFNHMKMSKSHFKWGMLCQREEKTNVKSSSIWIREREGKELLYKKHLSIWFWLYEIIIIIGSTLVGCIRLIGIR